MKITLRDGQEIRLPFSPGNSVGYRAKSIEIERDDVLAMLKLAKLDMSAFYAAMMQLSGRFDGLYPHQRALIESLRHQPLPDVMTRETAPVLRSDVSYTGQRQEKIAEARQVEHARTMGMQSLARLLDATLNVPGVKPHYRFFLLVSEPPTESGGETPVNYVSNCDRADIVAAMKEVLARWEGQPQRVGRA